MVSSARRLSRSRRSVACIHIQPISLHDKIRLERKPKTYLVLFGDKTRASFAPKFTSSHKTHSVSIRTVYYAIRYYTYLYTYIFFKYQYAGIQQQGCIVRNQYLYTLCQTEDLSSSMHRCLRRQNSAIYMTRIHGMHARPCTIRYNT